MAKRKIVKIDEEKCDGCGTCATACAEGAIAIIDGKAKLISEIYCDGLGACLGECPRGAISIEEREASKFDEKKTHDHLDRLKIQSETQKKAETLPCGCPGSMAKVVTRKEMPKTSGNLPVCESSLGNWPVQLKLIPVNAPYLRNADLLIVADCVPFALPDIHSRYMPGKVVIVGCPKLDDATLYTKKFADIFTTASPRSITILHMEVPCCTGLVRIVEKALEDSGKEIPSTEITIGIEGNILLEKAMI